MHTPIPVENKPARVVSLVPSITESMFDLGLGHCLVGITDYCVYPIDKVKSLPRVGGPKTLDVEKILSLSPDLILSNREENNKDQVESIMNRGIPVWAANPTSINDSIEDLWALAGSFHSDQARQIIRALEDSLEWVALSMTEKKRFNYFCPIWYRELTGEQKEWMVFAQDTYMSDLLSVFGGDNIFNNRLQNPEPSSKYYYVSFGQIKERKPDLILLPDEPFAFTSQEADSLKDLFDASQRPAPVIKIFDGSLLTWHGTRMAKALNAFPELLTF